jgi:hypothetical protein
MLKKISMFLLVLVFVMSVSSLGLAEEKKAKEVKLKGMMVIHPETKDIKFVTEDYQYHTIYYNKKTKVTATVKAKISDLEKEMEQKRLPKGTVTYVIKDGKPVAKKTSFKSRAKWGLKKKKKKK